MSTPRMQCCWGPCWRSGFANSPIAAVHALGAIHRRHFHIPARAFQCVVAASMYLRFNAPHAAASTPRSPSRCFPALGRGEGSQARNRSLYQCALELSAKLGLSPAVCASVDIPQMRSQNAKMRMAAGAFGLVKLTARRHAGRRSCDSMRAASVWHLAHPAATPRLIMLISIRCRPAGNDNARLWAYEQRRPLRAV